MTDFINKNNQAWWAEWLLVLSIVGYPILALGISLVEINSVVVSYLFRFIVLFISLALILNATRRNLSISFNGCLVLFWLLYITCLTINIFEEIPRASDALIFFLCTALIPGVALMISWQAKTSDRSVAIKIALMGGGVCVLANTIWLFGLADNMLQMTNEEAQGRLFLKRLNPISLGSAAVTTIIAILCLTRYKLRPLVLMGILFLGINAFLCIYISGSRGPFLTLILTAIAYGVMTQRLRLVLFLIILAISCLFFFDTPFSQRLFEIGSDASSSERLMIQTNSISQFIDSSLLGGTYVELGSLEYPHNIFLETMMATGLLGLIILLILLVQTANRIWRLRNEGQLILGLLLFQYFLIAQFSGSLWGNAPFWVLICVCNFRHRFLANCPSKVKNFVS